MDTEGLRERLHRQRARELRQRSTKAEALLWRRLRNRQIDGFKFRRQHPWGPSYILDFFCPAAKVAIELDGDWHEETLEADQERDTELAAHGIAVLRYWNRDVLGKTDTVIAEIREELQQRIRRSRKDHLEHSE